MKEEILDFDAVLTAIFQGRSYATGSEYRAQPCGRP